MKPDDRRKWLDILGVLLVIVSALVLYVSTRSCRPADAGAAPVIVAVPDTAAHSAQTRKAPKPKKSRAAKAKESQKPRSRDFRHEEVPSEPPVRNHDAE